MPKSQTAQRSGHSTKSIVIVIAVVAALTVVIGFQFRGSWVTLDVTEIGKRLAQTEAAKESAEWRLSEAVKRQGALQEQVRELQKQSAELSAAAQQLKADRDKSLSEVKTLKERCQAAESQSSHLSEEVVRLTAMLPPSPSEQEKQRSADEARLAEQSRLSQVNEDLRTRRMAERRLRWSDLLSRDVADHAEVEFLLAGKPSAILELRDGRWYHETWQVKRLDGRWSQETWEGPIRALCPTCRSNEWPSQLREVWNWCSKIEPRVSNRTRTGGADSPLSIDFYVWSLGEDRWGISCQVYGANGKPAVYEVELSGAVKLPFREDLGSKP